MDLEVAVAGSYAGSPLQICPLQCWSTTASPVSMGSSDEVHRVVQYELYRMQAFGPGSHLPAAFCKHIPALGTVPPSKEDQIPLLLAEDEMACYFPESMVIMPWGKVFIRRLCDLIKDHPEWNMDKLIHVCMLHLHTQHGNAGLSAVLNNILSYSSGTLDNLVHHMYPQGTKPLQEIVPLGTTPVEHISTLVNLSNQETDIPEPSDTQRCRDMCA